MGEPLLNQKTQLDASSGYSDEMLALLSEDQQPAARSSGPDFASPPWNAVSTPVTQAALLPL